MQSENRWKDYVRASKPARGEAAALAIEEMGGTVAASKLISQYTMFAISISAVSQWKRQGVPSHLVLLVAKLSGIEASALCPYGWWGE